MSLREAPFVILGDLLLELAVLDGLVHCAEPLPVRTPGPKCFSDRAERAAHRIADHAHVRLHPAVGVEDALVIVGVRAHGERDRAFDRFDDVGEADLVRRPGEREAAARAARAGQQAAGGELAHQFLRGGQRDAGVAGKLGRAEARARGAAGGGGHQNDRIIGEVAEAHI